MSSKNKRAFGNPRASTRRLGHREPRGRFLIVTGGLNTEPEYFAWVKHQVSSANVSVRVEPDSRNPARLVDRAAEMRRKDQESDRLAGDGGNVYDGVWVVVDVDEFAHELVQIGPRCAQEGIELAISNPCFEVWLMLHTTTSPDSNGKAVQRQAESAGMTTGSGAGKHPRTEKLAGLFEEAETRAKRLRDRHARDGSAFPHDAPSTNVDQLVRTIVDRAALSAL